MEEKNLWKKVLEVLEEEIDRNIFEGWFKNTREIEILEDRIIIEVPNAFVGQMIENVYMNKINNILKIMGYTNLKIIFKPKIKGERVKEEEKIREFYKREIKGLSSRYKFENFIVGKSNEVAFAASKAVAENPATVYNPLFIYGGVGLGKTHLLHAIGNYIATKNKNLNIIYTSTENIMNEMVEALQTNKMSIFRKKYRKVDVLLIDDVHFLQDKFALQEELFHTFNSLYDLKKQIVLTSDRPPWEIRNVEERLVSRFQWGLVVDIKPPDFETRVAILKLKAKEENVEITDDVINFIASKIKKNIRQLESSLARIKAFSFCYKRKIDIEIVKEILRDYLEAAKENEPERIIEIVAEFFNLTKEDILNEKKTKEVARVRQIVMYFLRYHLNMPLKEIGKIIGGRDHSTVIHGIEKIENLLEKDQDLKEKIVEIERKIRWI
ncbi:MAG: chromosomal replication initiator protein DnaA [candidate division WOR-3 bacterium]